MESKAESWYYTAKGGFYWAGAYVSDSFVLVGTDDGSNYSDSQTSKLLMFDRRTGALLDARDDLDGDIRSTVVYDEQTGLYCFTSRGGTFYACTVEDGLIGELWSIPLVNGKGNAMSTSSPVVYNGRAYIGVSGAGQFASYSGHSIHVLDLNTKTIAYTAETMGYPQTSGLLTTAYEEQSGYVYVYFFDNMTPGESVFDVLRRCLKEEGIHFEYVDARAYDSVYIEGIANLYEFDCGDQSGWLFAVNGISPSLGCSGYTVSAGDEIVFAYTCDMGADLGLDWME